MTCGVCGIDHPFDDYHYSDLVWRGWYNTTTTATPTITYATTNSTTVTVTGDQAWQAWHQVGLSAEEAANSLRAASASVASFVETEATRLAERREQRREEVKRRKSPPPTAVRIRERELRRGYVSPGKRERLASTADRSEARRHAQARGRSQMRQTEWAQKAAERRATQLLRMTLSAAEREHLDLANEVRITSQFGNTYVIGPGSHNGNVKRVDEHGCAVASFCGQPNQVVTEHDGVRMRMPIQDVHAGQVLGLKYDEVEFLNACNRYGGEGCRRNGGVIPPFNIGPGCRHQRQHPPITAGVPLAA